MPEFRAWLIVYAIFFLEFKIKYDYLLYGQLLIE